MTVSRLMEAASFFLVSLETTSWTTVFLNVSHFRFSARDPLCSVCVMVHRFCAFLTMSFVADFKVRGKKGKKSHEKHIVKKSEINKKVEQRLINPVVKNKIKEIIECLRAASYYHVSL